MPTDTAPRWLDIMPPIPLAWSVPVRRADKAPVCSVFLHETASRVFHADGEGELSNDAGWFGDHYRVDLDDPQGFAYALRYAGSIGGALTLYRHLGASRYPGDRDGIDAVILSWLLHGEPPTDADRLALARALADLV